MKFCLVLQDADTCGWSRRFCPTPGESQMTGMLCSWICDAGPTPDSISMCGEHSAPALSIISFPKTLKFSPPDSTSAPIARLPLNRSLCTRQSARTVRFIRCLAGAKYPMLVLHRMPLGLLNGGGPTPVESGLFASSYVGYPSFWHAL